MYWQHALLLFGAFGLSQARAIPEYSTIVSERTVAATKYDFVIAGGGISGLVLASRLTENPSVNVLVIEAGAFDNGEPGILIPGDWNPYPYFWQGLNTLPLKALDNRTSPVIAAKIVGGGSTINAMNWIRGTVADYTGWKGLGNPGYGWDDMLPYFKKTENFTAPDPAFAARANISFDPAVRGEGGPIAYSYPDYFYPGSANWWNAAKSIGLPVIKDGNAGSNTGLFWPPTVLNATSQTRCDAKIGYYDNVVRLGRPNYHILTNNRVSKILFKGNTATGLNYAPSTGGATSSIHASKEVLIAAGGILTPQLLQVSGIGPKALLDSLKIPVVSDLPGVGTNLQDQTTLPVPYNWTNLITPNVNTASQDPVYNTTQLNAYNAHQPSSYTIVKGLSTTFGGLPLSSVSNYASIISAAQAYNASLSLPANTDPTVLAGYKAQREVIISQYQNKNISSGILLWDTGNAAQIFSLKPLSRGLVTINSSSINDPPVIEYGTGTDPLDFDIILGYYHKTRELFSQPQMTSMGPIPAAPLGSNITTDDQVVQVIRETLVPTNAHQCCTAPMLPKRLGGVVDPAHKVYGVRKLRVVDVSTFPLALSAGPTPTVYAVAEKIADMIKKEWKCW